MPDAPRKSSEPGQFLKALRKEPVSHTPVWIMRQAGRYLIEYRRLRKKITFSALCREPELCAELTVMAQRKLGTDAAIIFADLLPVLETIGAKIRYPEGDGGGIRVDFALSGESWKHPSEVAVHQAHVGEALELARRALPRVIALLGFSGAPFTLASYLIEGGSSRSFLKVRRFMKRRTELWDKLMQVLSRVVAAYARMQTACGADAVQIFDTWAGCLTREEYRQYVLPYQKKLIGTISKEARVIHFGVRTGHLLDLLSEAGGDVIGVDHATPLGAAWKKAGYHKAVQGNLDPRVLLGSKSGIRTAVGKILDQAEGRPGHIFNLGHGILPQTPVGNAKYLVEVVHKESARRIQARGSSGSVRA
ncbi:MAG: uroporphyrinogen decarboxylase [Candidatus Omnitrophica bacterium]|nr:uroporphyrinogen decarboxylase [Candidatus Omnitrophota bacterium]